MWALIGGLPTMLKFESVYCLLYVIHVKFYFSIYKYTKMSEGHYNSYYHEIQQSSAVLIKYLR